MRILTCNMVIARNSEYPASRRLVLRSSFGCSSSLYSKWILIINKPIIVIDKLCLGNYDHCTMIIIIIIIIIIVTHLFSFLPFWFTLLRSLAVDASTSPCLHKNLMESQGCESLYWHGLCSTVQRDRPPLTRTVQHRGKWRTHGAMLLAVLPVAVCMQSLYTKNYWIA